MLAIQLRRAVPCPHSTFSKPLLFTAHHHLAPMSTKKRTLNDYFSPSTNNAKRVHTDTNGDQAR